MQREQTGISATFVLAATLLGLAGCAGTGLYGERPGPWQIVAVDPLPVTLPESGRSLNLRVVHPAGPGPFPVVVFSHGAFCAPEQYAVITDHWVAHGYVVILPSHQDALNAPPMTDPMRVDLRIAARLADMDYIFRNLGDIAAQAGIPGRMDETRLAAAGHSFGTVFAMAPAGLWLRGPDGEPRQQREPALRAVVTLSGVGQLDDFMAPDAFRDLTVPLMATGGTLDVGNVGRPPVYPWEWRMSPFSLAPAGGKYSVVLNNGDHYLGGLICRSDRVNAPDPEGAAINADLTLAFLDAYVRGDARAARLLATTDVTRRTAGRARLERK